MFVLHPDPYLQPAYRISPFRTTDIEKNSILPDDKYIDEYFDKRFNGSRYQYTLNGREAINIALSFYQLEKDDIVTILTTSGNFYVSGCVTKEIELFCKWSRHLENNTKVILIIHEFGYPYRDMPSLLKTKLPIIEDCAHSFFSRDDNSSIGKAGDYAIYSFPKMFPLQIGGLLVCNKDREIRTSTQLVKERRKYIKNILSYYLPKENEIIEKRLINYNYLMKEFNLLKLKERFKTERGIVPGVFMFQKGDLNIDLPELKKHFYAHGIQCSVFYGEESFFIPVHQALNESDLNYFIEVTNSFINQTAS
jgi:hypothetical protein